MILRRASAQPTSVLVSASTTTFHATPLSDPTTAAFDVSRTLNPAPTNSAAPEPVPMDPIGASLLTDRPDLVFAQEAYNYMECSKEILQVQTETLVILQQKLNSMNEDKELGTHTFFPVVTPSVRSVSANTRLSILRNDPQIRMELRSSFVAQPAQPSSFTLLHCISLSGLIDVSSGDNRIGALD
ncbi:hypothetical protein C8R41DRAFT_918579 [Lentinula lateritia]|uniref:Uncharacterized protein n=1 Tax=Lentinula lateritia TaxID=40482 RepID=A0ABQ8VM40_9AGAR|nr:hypothetical protein C8R41DRAFT_918579 [Lentinula lateritia]